MDVLGIITIMAAVVCYILALRKAGISYAWNSSMVVGLLVGFVLLIALFAAIQCRLGERAMVVPRLLRDRGISAGMAFIFFLAGSSWLFVYYVPIYFQVVDGVSAADSGIRTIPLVIGMTLATIISGGVVTAVGYHVPFLFLSSLLSLAGAALLYTLDIATPSSAWIGYQALAGLGFGFGIQVPIIAAQATMAPADISTATAMTLCTYYLSF
jgi:MFS transporter, DHA2 family, glioxin efflux transporter